MKLGELVQHRTADLRIERGERLVEQQHLRTDGEGARDRHALLLAAGELSRIALGVGFHADETQAFRHTLAHDLRSGAARPQAEGDILLGPHMREKGVVLHHHADIARVRRKIGDVAVSDRDPPAARAHEPCHGTQCRRLARPGRADERRDLAGPDRERQRIEDDEAAIGDRHLVEADTAGGDAGERWRGRDRRAGCASLADAIPTVNCR